MFCRHVFGNISGGFRGISRFLGNFAGPRPREISEALPMTIFIQTWGLFQNILVYDTFILLVEFLLYFYQDMIKCVQMISVKTNSSPHLPHPQL